MSYISTEEAAEKWGVSQRQVQLLCANGRVSGAVTLSKVWLIPADAEKPPDGRYKASKQAKKSKRTEGAHGNRK